MCFGRDVAMHLASSSCSHSTLAFFFSGTYRNGSYLPRQNRWGVCVGVTSHCSVLSHLPELALRWFSVFLSFNSQCAPIGTVSLGLIYSPLCSDFHFHFLRWKAWFMVFSGLVSLRIFSWTWGKVLADIDQTGNGVCPSFLSSFCTSYSLPSEFGWDYSGQPTLMGDPSSFHAPCHLLHCLIQRYVHLSRIWELVPDRTCIFGSRYAKTQCGCLDCFGIGISATVSKDT